MKRVITLVLLLSGICLGQVIDGSQTPAQIPDSVAYRMLFKALTSPRAANVAVGLGLTQADQNALKSALSTFSSDYESQVVSSYPSSPTPAIASREALVSSVRDTLSSSVSPDGLAALDTFVQNQVKTHTMLDTTSGMTFTGFYSPGVGNCGIGCIPDVDPDLGDFALELYLLDGWGGSCASAQNTSYTFNGGNIWQGYDDAAVVLTQLSSSLDGTVYGVNKTSGHIYAFNAVTRHFDLKPGSMAQVTVGNGPNVWGTKANGDVYQFDHVAGTWTLKPGNLSQVSISPDGVTLWGINSTHSIYKWTGSAWIQITGQAKYISVSNNAKLSGNNVVRIIGTDSKLYSYSSTGTWTAIFPTAPAFVSISAADGGVLNTTFYGITSGNTVYSCGTSCTLLSGQSASQIAMGNRQHVIAVDTAGHVQRFLATSTTSWTDIVGGQNYADYSYEAATANLTPGMSFSDSSTTTTSQNQCGWSFFTVIKNYLQFAFTRSFNDAHGTPGQFCHYTGATYVCDWPLEPWCTPATTPPNFIPLTLEIDQNIGPTVWATDGNGVCGRLDPSHPWYCVPTGAPVFTYTVNLPHAADCTKNP